MRKIIKNYFNIALLVLIISPLSAQAFSLDDWFDDLESYFETATSTSQIINKVNVSASTGGNTAEPGQVIQGQSEVKVHIESSINGESVEPINIEVQSEEKEARVKVEQKITYPDEEGQASVERKIEINEQIETEEESIDQDIEPIKISQLTNKISQWWSSFFGGLKETLASIVSFWEK